MQIVQETEVTTMVKGEKVRLMEIKSENPATANHFRLSIVDDEGDERAVVLMFGNQVQSAGVMFSDVFNQREKVHPR